TSHSDNESYTARDLMTAGEVKSMADDTELIIFANRPPMKVKKAYQFELFPKPERLLNQTEYEKNTNPAQIERLNENQAEFEREHIEREENKKNKLADIAKEKEEKEQAEKERRKQEAMEQ